MSLSGNINDSRIPRNRALRISVAGEKGGGGKTTASIHIAYEFQRRGKKVVVVDNDPQLGISNWNEQLPDCDRLTVVNVASELRSANLDLYNDYADIVIIDGSPGFDVDKRLLDAHGLLADILYNDNLDPVLRRDIETGIHRIFGQSNNLYAKSAQLVALSDFIVLPVKASNQDIVPLANYINKIIKPRINAVGDTFYGVLRSQVGHGKRRSGEKLVNTLAHNGFSYFDHEITTREAFARASWGSLVQTQAGRDRDNEAIAEVVGVVDEISALFELDKKGSK